MKRNRKTIASVLLLVLCAFVSARGEGVDDYIQARMCELHIPGLSLAVVRNGRIVKANGYGVANLEQNSPATPQTVYEIGSMTKQFTATAIMMLVEEGKVHLDDSITKYFPNAPEAWQPITIRHLLSHTSGIQNHVAVPGYLGSFKTNLLMESTPGREELLSMFFKLPLEFQPGDTWSYDNTGYYLLGLVVEKVSGESFWQFLSERIFRPVGMRATHNTDVRPLVANRAAGYQWVSGAFENRPVLAPFIAFSAGSILSSVEDLARWDAVLYTEKLLKTSSLEQMWTATRTNEGAAASFNYGFGWFVDSYHGHHFVQHSGGTPGFSSVIYRFLDDKLTIIILTNHSDMIIDQLAIDIAGMYVPALARPQVKPDHDPQTSIRLKEITSHLLNGSFDNAEFAKPMQVFLSTATRKAFWQWVGSHGALRSFVYYDREKVEEGSIVRYRLVLGDSGYLLSFRVGDDKRIEQIYWW
ncbi:MAG: serine hydrolase [Blastocatellia bacterium]|nr:MAG: serine hydrolase [Blastocatellia bacterium]